MYLRALKEKDVDLINTWLCIPRILKWFKNPKAWLDEINKRNDEFNFIKHFIVMDENKTIGFCQYYDYLKGKENWHNNYNIDGAYSIDYLIGDDTYLNKGNGIKIIELITKEITNNTNAKVIIVQPDKDNLISRKTLLSTGYKLDENNDVFYYIINK